MYFPFVVVFADVYLQFRELTELVAAFFTLVSCMILNS